MDDQTNAIPTKCKVCHHPTSTPLVCDVCHNLDPSAATMADHFSLLGLPRTFNLDDCVLYRKYVALSRHEHPDMAAGETPEVQELHLRMSAAVNDAYRTLGDPVTRGAYLLGLLGGKTAAEDKSVPDGFLGAMMMMQEELADAKGQQRQEDVDRIRSVLQTQHDGMVNRLTVLFSEYQESLACEAVRKDLLDEIRKQLNAISYVRKMISQ